MNVSDRPRLDSDAVLDIAEQLYGLRGSVEPLAGERDLNCRLTTDDGEAYVLKIAHPDEAPSVLHMQHGALEHLAAGAQPALFQSVMRSRMGSTVPAVSIDGRSHCVRLVSWVPGCPVATTTARSPALLHDIGHRVAIMERELSRFAHPAMHRFLRWDAKHAFTALPPYVDRVADDGRRRLLADTLAKIEARLLPALPDLPMNVIHNDVNDHNLLVDDQARVCGIIDFGDMVHTYRVCELAICIAYLMLGADDPIGTGDAVACAYDERAPLLAAEVDVLHDFIVLRLCMSVAIAAAQREADPDNAYLGVSEAPAWALLEHLSETPQRIAARRSAPRLLERRRAALSSALSLSYRRPLTIVRGDGQFLIDEAGRRYLDCVNNVCHVGHCHPRVVAAGQAQMARLNTNTRYLHEHIVEYAERLLATTPDPLSVCFFVNSGSEANDLALRLARTHTKREDVVAIDQAYHGHTRSLIDISAYKHGGPGGAGPAPTTHVVPIPDRYRGHLRGEAADLGPRYAADVAAAVAVLREDGRAPAAFIAESLLSCAGQIELPSGYLAAAYAAVHEAGGVCIADEVQVGFGRVGTHRWGFETQGVVPDIVTMGKPMGNGHPLAAVVTTRAVAESFDNGMEYFNTFGGNPVSCAIGLAVLDVIESEDLQANALDVGEYFLARLRELQQTRPLIGDVRGRGLFLGIELVRDRTTLEPADTEAADVVEQMKERGVLLSTDGPFHNVIKIKPPLVFTRDDVATVVDGLTAVLASPSSQ